MPKKTPDPRATSTAAYHTLTTFRCLTDDQVGQMQHFMLDCEWTTREAAEAYGVSIATAQKVRKSIPLQFVKCNQSAWARSRATHKNAKKSKRGRAA